MKRLLNLGVSDPLTLGMAHPVADRIETLGRAKALTKGGRAAVLGIMGGLAVLSAPFTLAADDTAAEKKVFNQRSITLGKAISVVNENGEERAYEISKTGERVPVQFERLADGTKRIYLSDGQVHDLPNIDFMSHGNLEGLSKLSEKDAIDGYVELSKLEGGDLGAEIPEEILSKLPAHVQEMLKNADSKKTIKIIQSGNLGQNLNFPNSEGQIFGSPDSTLGLSLTFVQDDNTLGQALRQIEMTERQLSKLAEDETLTYALENAMRDLESARISLKAAEERLQQGK